MSIPGEDTAEDAPANGDGQDAGHLPDRASARAALEHVLASESFVNAGRLSRFLRFAVERTLEGRGGELKEYVLGVEVFDRPSEFDPRTDSIVRVEARRLRAKLAEYYDQEGAGDTLVIRLRKGSYVPRFERRNGDGAGTVGAAAQAEGRGRLAEPGTPAREEARERPPGRYEADSPAGSLESTLERPGTAARRGRNVVGIGAALVLAVLAGLTAWWLWTARLGQSAGIAIAVLPVVNHSGDHAQDALADRLTDAIISELARVPALDVRSRTTVMQYRHPRRPLRDVARELEARFIVEASVVRTGDTVTIAARLVNADADRKVWVNDFSGHASDVPELARRAATAIAAAAVRPTGPR